MQRVALVTGAAQGIGEGIARLLAERGLVVAAVDLNEEGAAKVAAAISGDGGTVTAFGMDITSSPSVLAGVAAVTEQFGPVDVLVNCAGWDELMPFVDSDEAFWDRVIEINFKGALRLIHATLPGMIERGWGRVVNIASDAGRVGSSLESVYAGAKGGIIAFTKTIARETARKGVTANCVCPGPTDTPSLRRVAASSGDADAVLEAMTRGIPMRRAAQPAEIAAAVAFFASEEAGYVTGQTLSVSGGLTMA